MMLGGGGGDNDALVNQVRKRGDEIGSARRELENGGWGAGWEVRAKRELHHSKKKNSVS